MNTNHLTVYKSNAVIEAGYKLSLNELRILLACIAQIDSRKELSVSDKFELSAKDFAVIFEVTEDRAYHTLGEVARALLKRYLTLENPFPDNPRIDKLQTHWISAIYYIKKEGKIALSFSHELIPYLSGLGGKFTKYELKYIGRMTSVYAVRLYELLMQWKSTGKREVEIEWLKKQFELDSSYDRMFDLKKRVIDPAVKDINEYSNFSVQWEQRKTGRNVTHLIFTFAEKNPPEPEQPPAAATPTEPTTAVIKLTAEQQACFNWAKNQSHWKKFTTNKQSFLTCYNKPNSAIKAQYEMQTGGAKVEITAEEAEIKAKNARKLEITTLRNAIKQFEDLNVRSPNSVIENQIKQLKQQLEDFKMKS